MQNDDTTMNNIREALLFNCGRLFPGVSPETLEEFERVFIENKAVNEVVTKLYDIIVAANNASIKNWHCIKCIIELYKNNDTTLHEYVNYLDAALSNCNETNIN